MISRQIFSGRSSEMSGQFLVPTDDPGSPWRPARPRTRLSKRSYGASHKHCHCAAKDLASFRTRLLPLSTT